VGGLEGGGERRGRTVAPKEYGKIKLAEERTGVRDRVRAGE